MIDTLENVKTRLGIVTSDDDDLLDLFRDSADAWIANYCERDFAGGSFTEYHPGGSEFVFLRNYPVLSISSVKVDPAYAFGSTTLAPATSYVVHTERGVVQSLVGPFMPRENLSTWTLGPRIVQVVYSTATNAVPAEVLEAFAQLVGHWYRREKTQSGVGFVNVHSQRAGDVSSTYSVEQIAGLPIPPDVSGLLAPYRAPHL